LERLRAGEMLAGALAAQLWLDQHPGIYQPARSAGDTAAC
jgi:hypothetical protein